MGVADTCSSMVKGKLELLLRMPISQVRFLAVLVCFYFARPVTVWPLLLKSDINIKSNDFIFGLFEFVVGWVSI